jgi:hypothetical protein
LRHLDLSYTNVSDLGPIGSLASLEILALTATVIESGALYALHTCKKLQRLLLGSLRGPSFGPNRKARDPGVHGGFNSAVKALKDAIPVLCVEGGWDKLETGDIALGWCTGEYHSSTREVALQKPTADLSFLFNRGEEEE